jgi:hypothetical protein
LKILGSNDQGREAHCVSAMGSPPRYDNHA